jgi:hypothetical protein
LLTEAQRAIYIDFECLATKPPQPMLLGVLQGDGDGQFRQMITDDRLTPARTATRNNLISASSTDTVGALVAQALAEDRRIVGWSLFDRDRLIDARPDLADEIEPSYVQGRLGEAAMKSAGETASGGATGALTVGLPRCFPIACAQLAAFHSCSDDPHCAAEGASRFNARGKAFQHASESARALNTDGRTWCESHAREVETIELAALRRQVPVLRFIAGEPFRGSLPRSR